MLTYAKFRSNQIILLSLTRLKWETEPSPWAWSLWAHLKTPSYARVQGSPETSWCSPMLQIVHYSGYIQVHHANWWVCDCSSSPCPLSLAGLDLTHARYMLHLRCMLMYDVKFNTSSGMESIIPAFKELKPEDGWVLQASLGCIMSFRPMWRT